MPVQFLVLKGYVGALPSRSTAATATAAASTASAADTSGATTGASCAGEGADEATESKKQSREEGDRFHNSISSGYQ